MSYRTVAFFKIKDTNNYYYYYYFSQLAPLFGIVELKQARVILINLIGTMEKRCPEIHQVFTLISDLNSWDAKRVDQPDFDRRLEAYKKIKTLTLEKNLNTDLAFIVLHNSFYFVRCVSRNRSHLIDSIRFDSIRLIDNKYDFFLYQEQDISLRDNASFYLKEICPKIAYSLKGKGLLKQHWLESILFLVKKGIISENENVQGLSISLLGVMVSRFLPRYAFKCIDTYSRANR